MPFRLRFFAAATLSLFRDADFRHAMIRLRHAFFRLSLVRCAFFFFFAALAIADY